MKQVKKKILYIGAIIGILITSSGCSKLSYKEDTIYSENIFEDYEKDDIKENKETYIDREEALDKAFDILKNGLGVDVDRQLLNEYIKIVKLSDSFAWQIGFIQEQDKQIINDYYICIDIEGGDVREIIYNIIYNNSSKEAFDTQNVDKYKKNVNMSDVEIENIIKPLCKVLNINLEDYIKKMDYNVDTIVVKLFEKDEKHEKCNISININSKKINSFYMY
ncbi:hypothetical protein SAMN02910355_0219 [Terrisporobacter glycolicus]|nr:hypothetical protein SAMN02910355_0219 [Terrisporobacter glycolicus]